MKYNGYDVRNKDVEREVAEFMLGMMLLLFVVVVVSCFLD